MRTNNKPSNSAASFHGGGTRANEPWRNGICGKCGAKRIDNQLGLEPTPDAYVQNMVAVFREVRRVLKDDGTLWLNLGDSYANIAGTGRQGVSWMLAGGVDGYARSLANKQAGARAIPIGLKPKDLCGIPWRVAFALQSDGWYLRQDIIWSKPNPMPESVTDRCTKSHEYIFLLTKRASYYYDYEAISEELSAVTLERFNGVPSRTGGNGLDTIARSLPTGRSSGCGAGPDGKRNKRSVWHVATQPYSGSHFATFPEALIEPCILAGAPLGGLVLDPFIGSGTTGAVASRLGRCWVGCDLGYHELSRERTAQRGLLFGEATA